MATQLEVQQEINRLLRERTGLLKEQSTLLTEQVSFAAGLQKALDGASPKEIVDTVNELNEALAEASKKFEESAAAGTSSNNKISKSVAKAHTNVVSMARTIDEMSKKRWPAATAAALGFISGLVSGFKFVTNLLQSTLGFIGSVAEGFINIGAAIIAMPFRSLDALVSMASKLAGLLQEIATATEEVRKQFGDLSRGPSQAIISSAKGVGKQFESLGLGGYQIFGNLAERLRFVNEVATEMGAAFEPFKHEFEETSGAILLMQKGLGLASDDMRAFAMRAKSMGTTMTTQLKELTKFSQAFGKSFGVSAKLISRDMGHMAKDVKNFANLAPKELAKASVYARRLGIDVKDLLGVIEKFDTFEDAATSAAMLSQAFGVQVDAIKLMNAENPADRIDLLRQAFISTGQSAEKFNRQELKYLSTITGLSEETARAAFSQKNLGASLNDLEKQGKITEKRQLSTAEAVEVLNQSIERMIKAFRPFTGFLQAFADGFARGVVLAEPMRELLTAIYNALRKTYQIGIQVGRAFVEVFPGIRDVTAALNDLFSTKNKATPFNKFLMSVKDAFKDFFMTIGGPSNRFSLPTLMDRLKVGFFSWLDLGGRGRRLYESVKTFSRGMGNVVAGLVDVIASGLVKGIDFIVLFLQGGKLPNIKGDGIVIRFVTPIVEALQRNWQPVADAFVHLLKVAWDKAKPEIANLAMSILPWVGALIVGPAAIQAFIAWAATKLAGALGKAILGVGDKISAEANVENASKVVETAVESLSSVAKFEEEAEGISWSTIAKAAAGLALGITAIGVGVTATALMIRGLEATTGLPTLDSVLKFGALAVAMSTSAALVAAPAAQAGKFNWRSIASGMAGVAVGLLAVGAAVSVITLALKGLEAIGMPSMDSITKFGLVSAALSASAAAIAIPAMAAGLFNWKLIAKGMAGVALGMVAVGAAGAATLAMIALVAKIGIPTNVADLVGAIGKLFTTAALLVLPAAALGALLSGPQAAIILGVGAVGFSVLGVIANGLVAAAVPAIKMIASIDVPNPEKFKMVSTAVISVMRTIAKFTESISKIIETLADVDDEKFSTAMGSTKRFIDAVLADGFNEIISRVVSVSQQFEGKAQNLEGAKVIADVITAVSSFIGSVASVVSSIPDDGFFKSLLGMGDSFSNKMNAAAGFLSAVMLSLQTRLKPTLAGILALDVGDPTKASQKIQVISSMMGIVSSMVSTVKEFGQLSREGGVIDSTAMVELVLKTGAAFSPRVVGLLTNIITRLIEAAPLQAQFEHAISIMQNIEKFETSAIKSAQAMEKLHLEAAALAFYNDPAQTPTVQVIARMVEEANAVNDALANLPPVKIKTRLKELADKLGLRGEQFQVKSDKVNITIDLDVFIEAEKLARVLSEHGIVSTSSARVK